MAVKAKTKKQKDSVVEIEAEISADELEAHKKSIFSEWKKEMSADGFRKGNVPEEIAEKIIDQKHLLEDAAYSAIDDSYPVILEECEINPITAPRVKVTKLVSGSPIEFTVTVAVKPEFSMPDYRKITKELIQGVKKISVEEIEVDEAIKYVKRMRGAEDKDLTDKFVKTIGNFGNVSEFKQKIKENIEGEKQLAAKADLREKIAEALILETKIKIPQILLDDECARISIHLDHELEKSGMLKNDYFAKIKKTEGEFEAEERVRAEKQYKTKYIFEKIAEKENIAPSNKEVEAELSGFLSYYGGTDPDDAAKYVYEFLRNEKVISFLENGCVREATDEKKK
ncbi:hypothetical protein A3D55_00470 [Candidatus Jorgensenbacteria bacterium RIFCSPHIGHO2_02_FULL_45_20]|uniref:Trigger factor n=2 Tax=Candidatus Joergenseniibacteriota TaxID=1752739 RepID=A0A1F6BN45_9BACT|nr:MAG: Trigger factor [Candidatus Jorgensenbacteria bacterium GW2011_GWA2_45_9]OGG38192.1 MAG: hypothetical protein A3D55_00470 [Candidatus Jorgensenbacteria bacterium RIFCSPHIGHO2_02_FULL_45_20]